MFPRLAAVLWFVVCACGSRPEPKPDPGSVPVVRPETMASTPAAVSQPESAAARPGADSLPDAVKRTFPPAVTVTSVAGPFPHRVIRDNCDRVIGYEVFSDSTGTTARGYAGMVPVQVFLDAQARPVRIYILDNSETQAYVDIACKDGLLERLLAYDPAKPESVDAVTLATSSSHAIIQGVTGLADRLAKEVVAESSRGSR